jgi:hypothetical protein
MCTLRLGRSVPLSSLRSSSLTTHPPLRGIRVVSDRGTDRLAGRGWWGSDGGMEAVAKPEQTRSAAISVLDGGQERPEIGGQNSCSSLFKT